MTDGYCLSPYILKHCIALDELNFGGLAGKHQNVKISGQNFVLYVYYAWILAALCQIPIYLIQQANILLMQSVDYKVVHYPSLLMRILEDYKACLYSFG